MRQDLNEFNLTCIIQIFRINGVNYTRIGVKMNDRTQNYSKIGENGRFLTCNNRLYRREKS